MKTVLFFLSFLVIVAATFLWVRHGGGDPYPDLTTTPEISANALEEVLAYSEPIGNIAVSQQGRIFFSVHPESRPQGNKLLEYVNGASIPFPSLQQQSKLFQTPLGIAIDRFERLWVIDHGNHGLDAARIVGIDLVSGEVIRDQKFDEMIAPSGSLLQDLQVSADGRTIVIADASFWRKSPALIVYDVETGDARRVLEGDPSVSAEEYVIRNGAKTIKFLGGMIALRDGVDGIAMDTDWLYWGAMTGSGLYRIRLKDLRNSELGETQLASHLERFSDKPLSGGLSVDTASNIYITDVEHSAIFRVDSERNLSTLIRSRKIRWPDALSFGPDGYLYVADSALPELILKSNEHIEANAPYRVFRFQPGFEGIPGQ
jgi:sugar lactone lactonase YvrE